MSLFFADKEMSLAFGFALSFTRVGNIINFFVSPYLVDSFGFRWALWVGAMVCAGSLIFTLTYFLLERHAEVEGMIVSGRKKQRKISLKDIKNFTLSYWLLCIICGLFYTNIFAMYSVFEDLLKTLYDYSSFTAGVLASLIYFVSIPSALLMGTLVDKLGRRCVFIWVSIAVMIFFDYSVIFTQINPIVTLCIAGVAMSIVASTIWSTIPLLLPSHTTGTGLSLMSMVQMAIVGVSNILIGLISKAYGYKYCVLYFLVLEVVALVLIMVVKLLDYTYNEDRLDWYTPKKQKARDEAARLVVEEREAREGEGHFSLNGEGKKGKEREEKNVNISREGSAKGE